VEQVGQRSHRGFLQRHIYPKGATILQMLRHQLGDESLLEGNEPLHHGERVWKRRHDDLRKAFEETTGKDYKTFFNQWVYGAGFPVFQVSSLYDRAARRLVISAKEVQPRTASPGSSTSTWMSKLAPTVA